MIGGSQLMNKLQSNVGADAHEEDANAAVELS